MDQFIYFNLCFITKPEIDALFLIICLDVFTIDKTMETGRLLEPSLRGGSYRLQHALWRQNTTELVKLAFPELGYTRK